MTSRAHSTNPIPVSVEQFVRAETDLYFSVIVNEQHALGSFFHFREPMPIEHQTVIRANRDTLYSVALFDLDAGPVTVTLPDAAGRFMSTFAVSQDHFIEAVMYEPGRYTFDKDQIGTRYVMIGVRTLVDLSDPADIQQVHALQDGLTCEQEGTGSFEVPNWDHESQKRIRDALIVLSESLPDMRGAFGARGKVDPVRHLIASASAWGGNRDEDAIYLNVTPTRNDGRTPYTLTVGDVPVDGFWSVSVYNATGYFEANPANAYALNNLSARRNDDGTITINFGGTSDQPNVLPISPGWNYMVRLYRPRSEVLDGSWTFPAAASVG